MCSMGRCSVSCNVVCKMREPFACLHRYLAATRSTLEEVGGAAIGLPIGNLTSQIFANITLHEFDRFVLHTLKPRGYIRYGDDFVLFGKRMQEMVQWKGMAMAFLRQELGLSLHPRTGGIFPCRRGLRCCGWEIFPRGIRLQERTRQRALHRLQPGNIASYSGLVRGAKNAKTLKYFHWHSLATLHEYFPSSF